MEVLGKAWTGVPVLVSDGAWGTELIKRGLRPGDPGEHWNLTHPDIIADIAGEYRDAGSQIILTNTFGASRLRLAAQGLADEARSINRAGAQIAAEAVKGKAVVAGDIGPCGAMVCMGEVTEEELYDTYCEQATELSAGGAEWIVVETMTEAREMEIAVRAARDAVALPVVACMTYNRTPKGYRTMMGNPPEQCVERAVQAGASIIGANCGAGIEDYVPLAAELRGLTALPVWIKANAGIPELRGGKVCYPLGPVEFASYVPTLVAAGVNVIGGCCGTTPEFIREIVRRL